MYPALFKEITETYRRFGWTLRCALLTGEVRRELAETLSSTEANVSIENSDVNALWFSRTAGTRETYELRLLSNSPFALIEIFEQGTSPLERAAKQQIMVEKLRLNQLNFKV